MTSPWSALGSEADLPCWAKEVIESNAGPHTQSSEIQHRCITVPNAALLSAERFTHDVRRAYTEILEGLELDSIFRIWNFIPRIGQHDGCELNRYMRFNTARFHAFQTHSGNRGYPPASGVGHAGDDLVIHLLSGADSVDAVGNVRQVPPREYSSTWGPLPPVFARGALVNCPGHFYGLILSGTASVRGECTVHPTDIEKQIQETFTNINTVLDTAHMQPRKLDSLLVYVTHDTDVDAVMAHLSEVDFAHDSEIEVRVGPLCRPDLLVEIEGFTRLPLRTPTT